MTSSLLVCLFPLSLHSFIRVEMTESSWPIFLVTKGEECLVLTCWQTYFLAVPGCCLCDSDEGPVCFCPGCRGRHFAASLQFAFCLLRLNTCVCECRCCWCVVQHKQRCCNNLYFINRFGTNSLQFRCWLLTTFTSCLKLNASKVIFWLPADETCSWTGHFFTLQGTK